MCNAPSPPPPPPPPAPAPAPPTPAASVRQGSPGDRMAGEKGRREEEETLIKSRRRGRNALRIDMNVPGREQTGTNVAR